MGKKFGMWLSCLPKSATWHAVSPWHLSSSFAASTCFVYSNRAMSLMSMAGVLSRAMTTTMTSALEFCASSARPTESLDPFARLARMYVRSMKRAAGYLRRTSQCSVMAIALPSKKSSDPTRRATHGQPLWWNSCMAAAKKSFCAPTLTSFCTHWTKPSSSMVQTRTTSRLSPISYSAKCRSLVPRSN